MPPAFMHALIGLLVSIKNPPRRSERGLSQSAEIAILIGGAALIAVTLLGVVGPYVMAKLPR